MPEVTITLSEKAHRALCSEAAERGLSVNALIEERLEEWRRRETAGAMAILDKARRHYAKNFPEETEGQLADIAVEEVRRYRRERAVREGRAASSDS